MWLKNKLFLQVVKYFPYIILGIFLFLGLYLRLHNLGIYQTFWADDGGGHIKYMETIYYEHRLPSMTETYLAWHEPLYYVLLTPWQKLADLFGANSLAWATSFNILIYSIFLFLVWKISRLFYKNTLVSVATLSLFSVLFIGVKLSAYINNELLAQTYILWLIYLFIKLDLLSAKKYKQVLFWASLLAIGLWIKLTVLVVLLAAVIFLGILFWSRKYLWKYILIVIMVPVILNIPWLVYKKNNFGTYFTINIYDDKPRQSVVRSEAWHYIGSFNRKIFGEYPYWYSQPQSYFSILLSDSFGDYYNLFNNAAQIERLPLSEKILVGNGRYTTPQHWQAMVNINNLALIFFLIWFVGFVLFLYKFIKEKNPWRDYYIFYLLVLFGGWAALLYQNLRLPYLEAGVLKGHFIYYTYPLFVILAYSAWASFVKKKIFIYLIFFFPIILYIFLGWRILHV